MDERTSFLIVLFVVGISYYAKSSSGHASVPNSLLLAPSNVTVSNKTSTSLSIDWEPVNHTDILGYRIRYYTNRTRSAIDSNSTRNTSIFNNSSIFVCKNTTSIWLERLEIYTWYRIEVIAFTNGSFGNVSFIESFRTGEGVPNGPPDNVTAVNQSSTSIMVSWKAVPRKHRRGIIIAYIVTVIEDSTGNTTRVKNNGSRTVIIDGLKKFTRYKVKVSAETSKGVSPNASVVYPVDTAEDVPEAPPTKINFTDVEPHSIVVTWQRVPKGSLNGMLRGYKIRWNSSKGYHEETLKLITPHSPHFRRRRAVTVAFNKTMFFKLTNLSLYSNYSVEVLAFTIGDGPYSEPMYVMSGEGVPTSPPSIVITYNTSSTSIFVEWSPPPIDSIRGVLLGYEVSYTPAVLNTSHNASKTRRIMLCDCNTSVELKTLRIYTLYNITVAAFTKVGIGNESDIKQTRTDEEAPKAPPHNVKAVSETFSSIKVSWEPVPEEDQDGIIIQYQVEIEKWENGNVNTSNRTIQVTGLEMFVEYRVRVRAFTRIGPGPFSDPRIHITTKETAPPVAPTNVSGHAINSTSISVSWDINLERGFKLRRFIVSYRAKFHNDTWEQNKTVRVNSSKNTTIITGLRVFTEYEIKVAAATNFSGPYSQPIIKTTKEGVPTASPENVRASPETESSIRVTWDPVPKHLRNGNITGYRIEVKNSSQTVITNNSVCANNLTAVVNGLEMFVTYYFTVRAMTVAGAGHYSSYVNATTNQTVPKVALNVTATVLSNSSIRVTWNVAESIHRRLNTPHRYRVSYCAHCPGTFRNETETSDSAVELDKLLINVMYTIKVQAINITAKDGTMVTFPVGSYSKPVNETTLEGVPQDPPSNITAEPKTTTSIIVSWHPIPCDKRGGIITRYNIELHNSSGKIGSGYTASCNMCSHVVSGLKVFSNYSVRVQAVTTKGKGPFSGYYNATTHRPAPEVVPQNVKAEATGNSTIRVSWDKVHARPDIGFLGYRIKYETVGLVPERKDDVIVDKDTSTKILTNLAIFKEYKIQVAARTTQDGNYSDPLSVKTWEGVPTAPPSNPSAQILDSTSARINWGPVPKEHHNGIIKGYRVFYKTTGNDKYKKDETVHGEYLLLLKSLDKAAEYQIKVLAFTSVGNGRAYNFTLKTADDIPSKPPVRPATVNRLSPHKLNVSWEPVPQQFMHGTLIEYVVTYQKITIGDKALEEEPVKKQIVKAGNTSLVLEGLEPYAEYKIKIAARTAKGVGPFAFVKGETCPCEQHLTTNWRHYEPYVNVSEDGEPGQIIPAVLKSMVDACCGECREYYKTELDFKRNSKGERSLHTSSRHLLENMDDETDFTFPVYGYNQQDSYKGGYGYIPVIETAGVAFIVYLREDSTTQNTMFDSMIRCLPVLLLPILTAYVAGIIIWALERSNNPKDFPPAFIQGAWEGVWWAFVSMTTVGYGDRSPLSHKGRLFAIAWTLFGLIVIAITMAMLTTALTTVTLKSDYKLYGTKIAAEYNSPEYNLGTRRNAKFDPDKHYKNIDEVAQALINKEVEGILVDTYAAGLRSDLFKRPELLVSKVYDYKTAYGVVLSPSSTRLRTCFHRYMISHKAEVFKMIKKKVKPIETSNSTKSKDQTSTSVLNSSSPQFRKGLRYACITFGIVLALSLTYECIRRIRKRLKVHQQVQFKTKLVEEMRGLVKEFRQRMQEIREKIGEKHRRQIIRFWKLQRKASSSKNWLRISQVSPQPRDVIVTDIY